MPCLSSAQRTALLEDLETVKTQIEKANESLIAALKNAEVKQYRFNSGEGSQMTERRSPKEINDLIDELESKRDRIYRRLYGKSLQNLNLRRKSYSEGYHGHH